LNHRIRAPLPCTCSSPPAWLSARPPPTEARYIAAFTESRSLLGAGQPRERLRGGCVASTAYKRWSLTCGQTYWSRLVCALRSAVSPPCPATLDRTKLLPRGRPALPRCARAASPATR
jgi:hypothetical protein